MKSRTLSFEKVEGRRLMAADAFGDPITNNVIEVGITQVIQDDRAISIVGTDLENDVRVSEQKGRIGVNTFDTVSVSTGFENLAGDRSDVTNFKLGSNGVQATFGGNFGALTRGVPPAYNLGAFAGTTGVADVGTRGLSTIDFNEPVSVSFAARDIIEAAPNTKGFITFIGELGTVTVEVGENGATPPRSGDWDRIDSETLGIGGITQIVIDNRDANGVSTGITNIDDMTFSAVVSNQYRFNRGCSDVIMAQLGGGDDRFVNDSKVSSTVFGGDGNDVLIGGKKTDIFYGGAGNDTLIGNAGRDFLFGGLGRDVIIGGKGRDIEVQGGLF